MIIKGKHNVYRSRDLAKESRMIRRAEAHNAPQRDVYQSGNHEHDTALNECVHERAVLARVICVVHVIVWFWLCIRR